MTFQVDFRGAVKRVMILMMLADGDIRNEEVEAICDIYRRLTEQQLSPEDVEREVYLAKSDGRDIEQFLTVLSVVLAGEGKSMIIKAAYLIAVADGELHESEKSLIMNIARCLNMSQEEVQKTLHPLTHGRN